jgi:hypothetical protein
VKKFFELFFHPAGIVNLTPYCIGISSLAVLLLGEFYLVDLMINYEVLTPEFFLMNFSQLFVGIVIEYGFPYLWLFLFIAITYSFFILQIKRLRFLGYSRWWLLLSLYFYWWIAPIVLMLLPTQNIPLEKMDT